MYDIYREGVVCGDHQYIVLVYNTTMYNTDSHPGLGPGIVPLPLRSLPTSITAEPCIKELPS